jgi:parallel beta-helix repeat protein
MPLPANRTSLHLAALIGATLAITTAATAQTAPRTFSVANSNELWGALDTARGGDTILLAPGHYGNVVYDRFRFTGGFVTIRSADPANRARFGQIFLRGTTGIAFTGVDIQTNRHPLVSISGTNIRFAGNTLRGANPNGDPWDDDQTGMWIRNAGNVVIASNDFQDLRAAIWVQRSTSVAIRHNDFTVLREGLNISGATRGDIDNNFFSKFAPKYPTGEHPDAIQFWNANETTGVTHYRIRNNFLSLGNDGHVQGIFLGTENRALPHSNLEISGNIYYGASFHGISLAAVTNSRIFNNTVVGSPWSDINNSSFRSADGRQGGGLPPAIALGTGAGVEAWNNAAFHLRGSTTGTGFTNSIDIWDSYWKRGEPLQNVLAVRPTSRSPALSEFVSAPTSVAASRGIGILAPFRVGVVTLDPAAAQTYVAAQPLP